MLLRSVIPAVLMGAVWVASAAQAAVTYHRDIAPILLQLLRALPPSRPVRAVPAADLRGCEAARRQIAAVTRRRYMPPWLPEPGYGDFVGRAPAQRCADSGRSRSGRAPALRRARRRRPAASGLDAGVGVGPAGPGDSSGQAVRAPGGRSRCLLELHPVAADSRPRGM